MVPNSVINMAAGRDKDWRNFQKKMKEKRVAGKEKKAKGKGVAAYLTTPSQFKGLAQKSQGNCRSTPALGPVYSCLMNSKNTRSRI